MTQGWFESDEDYQQRLSREANERIIEESGGNASQRWLESDEEYTDRLRREANEAIIEQSGGSATQGWLESDEAYTERVSREANERVIEQAGNSASQGWLESDQEYAARLRREANESLLERSGDSASQRLFESDRDYARRLETEANARIIDGRAAKTFRRADEVASSDDFETSGDASHSIGSARPTTSGRGSGMGALVIVGAAIGALFLFVGRGGQDTGSGGRSTQDTVTVASGGGMSVIVAGVPAAGDSVRIDGVLRRRADALSEGLPHRIEVSRPGCGAFFESIVARVGTTLTVTPRFVCALSRAISPHPLTLWDEGACPFEGCVYRTWISRGATRVFSRPDTSADVVGQLSSGDFLDAVTGHVVTREPGMMVVGKDTTVDGELLRAGDSIPVYTNLGEGFFRSYVRGRFRDIGMSSAEVASLPRSEWWIKARLQNGVVGWVEAAVGFVGAAQFGGGLAGISAVEDSALRIEALGLLDNWRGEVRDSLGVQAVSMTLVATGGIVSGKVRWTSIDSLTDAEARDTSRVADDTVRGDYLAERRLLRLQGRGIGDAGQGEIREYELRLDTSSDSMIGVVRALAGGADRQLRMRRIRPSWMSPNGG